jgi:hypothetical protein
VSFSAITLCFASQRVLLLLLLFISLSAQSVFCLSIEKRCSTELNIMGTVCPFRCAKRGNKPS